MEGLFAATSDTVLIGLQEILQTNYQSREPEHVMRINGLNSIYLDFTAEMSANQLTLKKQIEEKIAFLKQKLPQGYQLHKTYDATEYISDELDNIYYIRNNISTYFIEFMPHFYFMDIIAIEMFLHKLTIRSYLIV